MNRRAQLSAAKRALLGRLAKGGAEPLAESPLPAVPGDGPFPLSYAQESIWLLDRLAGQIPMFNTANAGWLPSQVTVAGIERALAEVVDRHDALRTGIRVTDGEPELFLLGSVPVHVPVTAIASTGPREREKAACEAALAIAERPFTLDQPPLWRAEVVRFSAGEQLLVFAAHHIVVDATSLNLLIGELAGTVPSLDQPGRYVDFAVWQRDRVASGAIAADLDHWRRELANLPPALRLPADFPRPPVRSLAGTTLQVDLDDHLAARLRDVSRQERVTPYMTMLAAFTAVLYRYTGETDILIGSTVAGRAERPEFRQMIGMFVNMVALRISVSGHPTFRELLGRAARTVSASLAHQAVPFDVLIRELGRAGDRTRPSLVQVAFNMPIQGPSAGYSRLRLPMITRGSQLDLTLHVVAGERGALRLEFEYSTDLFEAGTVRRMADHLIAILDAATRDPGVAVEEIRLARDTGLTETLADEPAHQAEPLHHLFERQARLTPDAVAVVAGGQRISYGELDARADRLGRRLRAMGVGPETRVGIFQRRGVHVVEALLAVWKAGGAYVPLDPDQPLARSRDIVVEAGIRVILAHSSIDELPAAGHVGVVNVDDPGDGPGDGPAHTTGSEVTGANAAYVMYTSGSTGRPKGVVITHAGIANRVLWPVRDLGLSKSDRILQKTSLTFDAAGWEIFAPLVVGGTVVLAPQGAERDPELLLRAVAEHDITVLQVVPSVLRLLVESAGWRQRSALRLLFSAGEPLTAELCTQLRGVADVTIYNTYGPTECSIDATAYRYRPEQAAGPVPIGHPIAQMRALILDPGGRRVPEGMAGELYLGGAGVGRGYLGRPDLTADRFVPDPSGPAGARLYRTGDLVRSRTDGAIEFIGRLDAQVKVNGMRIEPAEVEAALTAHPAVRGAAVAAVADATGGRRLVGYVVAAAPDVDLAQVRRFLLNRLPAAMVPAAFVVLDALPFTASGKLDRKALPPPSPDAPGPAARYVAPATHTEQAVASVWADLLGCERIGRQADFFELGGHSLLLARLAAKLRSRYDINVEIAELYTATTVEAQARLAAESHGAAVGPIERLPGDGPFRLSSGQLRMWFLDQLDPGSTEFVVPLVLSFDGPVDMQVLERSVAELVGRHEILRSRYVVRDGTPVQIVDAPSQVPVRRLAIPAAGRSPGGISELAIRELAQPLDLERGPVLRCLVAEISDNRHAVILGVHHIACDGWSMRLLARDLREAYSGGVEGRPRTRPDHQLRYADYASWQQQRLSAPGMRADLEHWCAELDGVRPLDLPIDHPRPALWSGRGKTIAFTVPADLAKRVVGLGRRHAATPFMTLLAVYQILLARQTGTTDIVIGTPVAGRSHPETAEIVGFFVNNLVIRTDLSGDPDFAGVLARTRQTALAAYARQDVPFDLLVERLARERDPGRKPLFQTMFEFGGEALPPGLADAAAGTSEIPWPTASYDVTVSLSEREDGSLQGLVEYATDLFESATIERLIGEYVSLVAAVAARPDVPVSRLSAASGEETPRAAEGLPEAFAAQAARTPDAVAVEQAGTTLTYAELRARVDRLAARLRRAGVERETPVAVCLGRSPELVTAMLGVMRAGGVYLPVDPDAPESRHRAVLDGAAVEIVVTVSGLEGRIRSGGRRIVLADADHEAGADNGDGADNGNHEGHPAGIGGTDPDSLAYVVHTSGSSGQPKGVMISHGTFLSHLRGIVDLYRLCPGERLLMLCPPVFDVAVEQIGSVLISGATLVLADEELLSPAGLPGRIARQRITKLEITPAYLREMLDSLTRPDPRLRGLNLVNVGADVILHEDVQRLLATELPARLVCTYGPTETTVTATLLEVSPAETAGFPPQAVVPIGRPLHDTSAYVLDEELEPLADHLDGELYLAGPRLARGYIGRPDLTADRFVPDPFTAGEGARMYRTGDRVRRRADGVFEFLGRLDDQVKIRGFRVEPGEIEAALAIHPQVREACVVPRSAGADRHLVAHVVPRSPGHPPAASDLAADLRTRLPSYMVPNRWAMHGALPRTASGKVDRRALTDAGDVLRAGPDGDDLAEDPVEARIAGIWSSVLGVERIGRYDNFFDLGGNSLLATRAHIRLKEAFGIGIPLRQFFDTPTVAGLGAAVRQVIKAEIAAFSDDQVKKLLR